jgi:hypothetical protein
MLNAMLLVFFVFFCSGCLQVQVKEAATVGSVVTLGPDQLNTIVPLVNGFASAVGHTWSMTILDANNNPIQNYVAEVAPATATCSPSDVNGVSICTSNTTFTPGISITYAINMGDWVYNYVLVFADPDQVNSTVPAGPSAVTVGQFATWDMTVRDANSDPIQNFTATANHGATCSASDVNGDSTCTTTIFGSAGQTIFTVDMGNWTYNYTVDVNALGPDQVTFTAPSGLTVLIVGQSAVWDMTVRDANGDPIQNFTANVDNGATCSPSDVSGLSLCQTPISVVPGIVVFTIDMGSWDWMYAIDFQ